MKRDALESDGQGCLPSGGEPIVPSIRPVVHRVPIGKGFDLVREGDLFVVFFGAMPLYHFRVDDTPARYLAAVDLVRHHGVKVLHVAAVLGMHRVTLHKMLKRFDEAGIQSLFPGKGRRMPTKIRDAVERRLLELKQLGATDRQAARRLGLSATGVKSALRRLRYVAPSVDKQLTLPTEAEAQRESTTSPQGAPASAPAGVQVAEEAVSPASPEAARSDVTEDPCSPVASPSVLEGSDSAGLVQDAKRAVSRDAACGEPTEEKSGEAGARVGGTASPSVDVDPLNRQGDRLLARLGLLDDAAPMFAPGVVPGAGVLLAVPVLIASGIFDIAPKVYGGIGPAFYGLRTSIVALLLMALLRIKRPENLKDVSPPDLGRVIGLDRAPEMKTLRRKLEELAARGKALEFMRLLAHIRAKQHTNDLAYLYIDGHVRVYNGQERISKAYVMQRRLAMPGTTDYWVNDQGGQPLLVITAEANEGLSKMLRPVLAEVRGVIGDRRVTVAFDRGGWNTKLFKTLVKDDNWDILTYRKGAIRRVLRNSFRTHKIKIDRREISYELSEKNVRIGGLKLRQITVLGKHDHQTHIVTSKQGIPAAEIAYRMFGRWRQENYFKYMKAEFALDALVENGVEAADPTRMVPNPERKAVDKELAAARADLAKLEREYGAAAFENKEDERRTMRGFKIANGGAIGKPLREARDNVKAIKERRKCIPTRVTVTEALKNPPVRLRTEMKLLSDTFKMVAYQSETALVELLRPHYRRTDDEGRTLIANALQSAAELTLAEGELKVTLAAQSSPHRTRAIAALCGELNKLGACYPGTSLRLRYAVAEARV